MADETNINEATAMPVPDHAPEVTPVVSTPVEAQPSTDASTPAAPVSEVTAVAAPAEEHSAEAPVAQAAVPAEEAAKEEPTATEAKDPRAAAILDALGPATDKALAGVAGDKGMEKQVKEVADDVARQVETGDVSGALHTAQNAELVAQQHDQAASLHNAAVDNAAQTAPQPTAEVVEEKAA